MDRVSTLVGWPRLLPSAGAFLFALCGGALMRSSPARTSGHHLRCRSRTRLFNPPPVLLSSRPFPPHSEPGIGSACKRLQQNSLHPARRDHCCASCGFDLRRIANGRSNRLNCPSLPGTEPSTPPSRSHGGQMAWQARTISSAGTLPSGFRDSPGLRRGYFRYRREISRMYSECSRAGPFTAAIIGTTMSRMFMRTFLPSR